MQGLLRRQWLLCLPGWLCWVLAQPQLLGC